MAICLWHKCGAEFEPKKINQKFCCDPHKIAHNNWLKMTGIHLCPRALYYVQGLSDSRVPPISVAQMANEMILKMANADGEPLTQNEAFGLNGGNEE